MDSAARAEAEKPSAEGSTGKQLQHVRKCVQEVQSVCGPGWEKVIHVGWRLETTLSGGEFGTLHPHFCSTDTNFSGRLQQLLLALVFLGLNLHYLPSLYCEERVTLWG